MKVGKRRETRVSRSQTRTFKTLGKKNLICFYNIVFCYLRLQKIVGYLYFFFRVKRGFFFNFLSGVYVCDTQLRCDMQPYPDH